MRKLSALLLISVFVLSLAACKKNNTSSDASSTSFASLQSEQSESASSEQAGEDVTVSSEESKPESVSSTVSPDKKGNTSKTSPKQNVSSQPKQSTPSQNPDSGTQPTQPSQPTQPTQPTKLNPKTDFKYGKYFGKYFGENNQRYYEVYLTFNKEYGSVEITEYDYCTKEYLMKEYGTNPENMYINKKVLNGITYYDIGMGGAVPEGFEITDTVIKISRGYDTWEELSLNADGTLTIETSVEYGHGAVGTIYTFVQE
ncbi:MAG TPA: hypothetical protein DDY61_04990 [Ruminococcaceae bacterium]|nr:hypothetical protein [Oscillospiraceae bacterium]